MDEGGGGEGVEDDLIFIEINLEGFFLVWFLNF